MDYQLSPSMRLMGKGHYTKHLIPFGTGSATNHPASTNSEDRTSQEYLGQFTHVMSSRASTRSKLVLPSGTSFRAT